MSVPVKWFYKIVPYKNPTDNPKRKISFFRINKKSVCINFCMSRSFAKINRRNSFVFASCNKNCFSVWKFIFFIFPIQIRIEEKKSFFHLSLTKTHTHTILSIHSAQSVCVAYTILWMCTLSIRAHRLDSQKGKKIERKTKTKT